MEKKKEIDYFEHLKDRLLELIALPVPKDKFSSVDNLICRYTSELRESAAPDKTDEEIGLEFKHYVKNILSIIETLIDGSQYKALRRLLQNEIYSCQTVFLNDRKKTDKKG